MDWQDVAMGLGSVAMLLGGGCVTLIASHLSRVSKAVADVATVVHGLGIRLDYIERDRHERP